MQPLSRRAWVLAGKAGGKPLVLSTEQTRALVRRDVERWSKLVRDLGIKVE